ncbi:hypothetical protein [uncultured Flavonifractor sp.]|uniref:hypothetical protein n=1 Tax=uncultured Flavonifractor sp. TaxID=1193534 RepID=UPI0025927B12|nr:hypothetical protein [uncultured Flavonifractor sp.]
MYSGFGFWNLVTWLFIAFLECSMAKASGTTVLSCIFEALGVDLRPRAEAWWLVLCFFVRLVYGPGPMVVVIVVTSVQLVASAWILRWAIKKNY